MRTMILCYGVLLGCGETSTRYLASTDAGSPDSSVDGGESVSWQEVPNSPICGPHTATLLRDGRVLVLGSCEGDEITDGLIFDPAELTWRALPDAPPSPSRGGRTAVLLDDGRVLIAGGADDFGVTNASSFYDPATGFSAVTFMTTPRAFHTSTLLEDGRVLVAGGQSQASASADLVVTTSVEIFDPRIVEAHAFPGRWTDAAPLQRARAGHAGILMPLGEVAVIGGSGDDGSGTTSHLLRTIELYDPMANRWRDGAELPDLGIQHATALLGDGGLLVTGRFSARSDPTVGEWRESGPLAHPRDYHLAVRLRDGRVLVVGGIQLYDGTELPPELYDPAADVWTTIDFPPGLADGIGPGSVTLLDDGRVLIIGAHVLLLSIAAPK
jgi:hypothetical protein